jgi:hypothetical protein
MGLLSREASVNNLFVTYSASGTTMAGHGRAPQARSDYSVLCRNCGTCSLWIGTAPGVGGEIELIQNVLSHDRSSPALPGQEHNRNARSPRELDT